MNKKKVLLIGGVLIILLIIALVIFRQNKVEIEGEYTGYQMILTANYRWGCNRWA